MVNAQFFTFLGALTASVNGMFRFDCFNNLVIDRVDPIVFPGKASGHLHVVSGGNGFSMTATGNDLLKSSCTSCPIGADLSAYWVPQLYVKYRNGTFGIVESHQIVYYEPRPLPGEKVYAFPPGLKMLAGNPMLRSPGDSIQQAAITWVCLDYNNPHPEQQGIPNFKCPNGLRGQVNFPMCWNGKDLDSPDHKSHVAYAEGLDGGKCPDGYKKIVKLFYEAFYSVDKYDSEWVNGKHPFVLANGDPTGYGFHGDFLNGWDVNVLQAAVDQCADKNFFNAGECPPLSATFKNNPPAQRCTTKRQIVEPIDLITALPGDNPVTTAAPTPAPPTLAPGTCTITEKVNFESNDVGNVQAPNPKACCTACKKFSASTAFSYFAGTCYCKSKKGAVATTSVVTSGVFA
ncbi:WSC domain protein [Thraustotheca clavata]|uniref:WSC domain protein n=1 Tax=Thraustotheca clavata TaxID=74557 RepID=A0A1V9ZHV6_9STRA|nr:WSC domain protein [Thraustotheca clavata]